MKKRMKPVALSCGAGIRRRKAPPALHLFLLLALFAGLRSEAAVRIQDVPLNVQVRDAGLETIIKIIRQQSDYLFIFKDENLARLNTRITLQMQNASISEVMDKCLAGSPLTYRIVDKTVILMSRETPGKAAVKLTGIVTDADSREPLPGVSVALKGASGGTVTDANGRFAVQNADLPATLVFTFIGYTPKSVVVTDEKPVQVLLQRETRNIQQVVVVGYGTQKKTELTGSISTFRPDELNARPVLGPDQMLQGRMPGVNISSSSGMPGAGLRVSVRGTGSLSASNEPLYVIDGVPIIPHDAGMFNFGGRMTPSRS